VNPLQNNPSIFHSIKNFLLARWKGCDCGGGNNYEVSGYVILVLSERNDKIQPPAPTHQALSCVSVTCSFCGLTKLLNLKTAGLL